METFDARGLACPEPVLVAKRALEQNPHQNLTILVNSTVARDNVHRFLGSRGCLVEIETQGEDFLLRVSPGGR